MSWRERFLLWFGSGFLGGVTFGDWLALLRENHFAIDPPYWLRATIITLGSLGNSLVRRRETAAYRESIAETKVESPIFVLGIWRSGTTHLQNLFAVDDRFAFPNAYQVTYPHTFLCTEKAATRLVPLVLPRKRLQDNMRFGFEQPSEDELALCITTFRSEMLSLVFPRRADHYDCYLTLRGVPEAEVAEWKDALLWFTKKLSWKCSKPLVLKSPHRTHSSSAGSLPRRQFRPRPYFSVVEPSMRSYVASLSGYEKNTYMPLVPQVRERIAKEWRRCFEEWGYPI